MENEPQVYADITKNLIIGYVLDGMNSLEGIRGAYPQAEKIPASRAVKLIEQNYINLPIKNLLKSEFIMGFESLCSEYSEHNPAHSSFQDSELYYGQLTTCYVRIEHNYYSLIDYLGSSHKALLQRIKDGGYEGAFFKNSPVL